MPLYVLRALGDNLFGEKQGSGLTFLPHYDIFLRCPTKANPEQSGDAKPRDLGPPPRRRKSVELPEAFDRMNPLASDEQARGSCILGPDKFPHGLKKLSDKALGL
jgi:hypothetical protein